MKKDPRVDLILQAIISGAQEIFPDKPVPDFTSDPEGQEIIEQITFGLKVFDKLLPVLVTAFVDEYKRQNP